MLDGPLNILPSINNKKLSDSCIDWFSSKIKFSSQINNDVDLLLNKFNLSQGEFDIVHLRLGDESSFLNTDNLTNHFDKNWFPDKEDCYRMCLACLKSSLNKPLLILSDNNEIKKHIKEKSQKNRLPIYVPHLQSSHTQKEPSYDNTVSLKVEDDSFYYAAFDAKLISLSCSVRSFSVYFWGSGFSCWFAKIFNKPFYCRPFIKRLT